MKKRTAAPAFIFTSVILLAVLPLASKTIVKTSGELKSLLEKAGLTQGSYSDMLKENLDSLRTGAPGRIAAYTSMARKAGLSGTLSYYEGVEDKWYFSAQIIILSVDANEKSAEKALKYLKSMGFEITNNMKPGEAAGDPGMWGREIYTEMLPNAIYAGNLVLFISTDDTPESEDLKRKILETAK